MMKNGILTVCTFISAVLFPWPLTAALAAVSALFEPLVPLAAGMFADTLYFAPVDGALPLFTLYGLALTAVSILVRRQLRTGIIR